MAGIAKKVTVLKNPHGEAKQAFLIDGTKVERIREDVFLEDEGWNRFVEVAQYLPHFIYENPYFYDDFDVVGFQSRFMCTCGSDAVVMGYAGYRTDASPTSGDGRNKISGEMLACRIRQQEGKHVDGVL